MKLTKILPKGRLNSSACAKTTLQKKVCREDTPPAHKNAYDENIRTPEKKCLRQSCIFNGFAASHTYTFSCGAPTEFLAKNVRHTATFYRRIISLAPTHAIYNRRS